MFSTRPKVARACTFGCVQLKKSSWRWLQPSLVQALPEVRHHSTLSDNIPMPPCGRLYVCSGQMAHCWRNCCLWVTLPSSLTLTNPDWKKRVLTRTIVMACMGCEATITNFKTLWGMACYNIDRPNPSVREDEFLLNWVLFVLTFCRDEYHQALTFSRPVNGNTQSIQNSTSNSASDGLGLILIVNVRLCINKRGYNHGSITKNTIITPPKNYYCYLWGISWKVIATQAHQGRLSQSR